MAALLPRCLDSLVAADRADLLDVIVVNDGSKDNSSAVAHAYEQKYKSIVSVIDKPNGNYGSTINAALPSAKGKYVKILDSDDWFDTKALDSFINALRTIDADVIQTPFTQIGATAHEVVRYNTMGREPYEYGRCYLLDDILPDGYIRFFLMHGLTYRTGLLRQMNYQQTEGISYTDTEWACYPFFYARTIVFLDCNLYQYNLDREGQTMDPKVLLKSLGQIEKVTDQMLAYYETHIASVSAVRQAWLKQYYENRVRILYKIYLLDMPRKDFNADDMQAFDDKYWHICQHLSLTPKLYPANKLLRIEYIRFWHKHHRRWSPALEALNHCLDVMMQWLYVKFIRH